MYSNKHIKKTTLISLSLIIVIILLALTFSFVVNNSMTDDSSKTIDGKSLNTTYNEYYKSRLAYSKSKTSSNIFMGESRPSGYLADEQLKVINAVYDMPLQINDAAIEKRLSEFSEKSFDVFFNQPAMRNEVQVIEFSETDIGLVREKAGLNIKYNYIYDETTNLLSPENQKANSFVGTIGGIYYLKCNELKVFNLSSSWEATLIQNNKLINPRVSIGVTQNCDSQKVFAARSFNKVKLIEKVKNKENVIYDPAAFSIDSYSSGEPSPDDLRLKPDSKITIKDFEVEYVYLEGVYSLVPLLKVNGTFNSLDGEKPISYWTWLLDN